MNQPGNEETLRLIDVAPSTWFTQSEGSSIWISGYRMFRVTRDDLLSGPKTFDLNQVRGIILYGRVKYPNSLELETTDDHQIQFTVPDPVFGETKEGTYLLLLTPLHVDGQQGNELIVKERIGAAVGLLSVFNGRNMVYERLFEFVTDMQDGRTVTLSPVTEHPLHFDAPDINEARLSTISEADQVISDLPELDRNRIRLSLRWFESALYAGGSVDAYLKYWFAIETLGMPNTTNIRPLIESLSRAYSLSYEEAQTRFSIGRLFGLRSRIVHDGQIVPIHQRLSSYLEALYADILNEQLGLSSEHRADRVLNDSAFELNQYLHEV